jgi:FtsZ-binding cell division protein ZapB
VRLIFTILVIFLFVTDASGQKDTLKHKNDTLKHKNDTLKHKNDTLKHKNDTLPERFYLLQNVKRDGVTMPEVEIKEVTVAARPRTARRNEYRKYERLIYNIKRVYPYALMVRIKLNQVNEDMKNITDEKERKNYMKDVEKDVFAEYEDDIQEMTITQGRLLIKLIDRETQNTSYVLIRDYRGKFAAAFWQGIARIFGTNLKEEYDPYGEDALIELIIREVDAGRL